MRIAWCIAFCVLVLGLYIGTAGADDMKADLAPTGRLRIAVYEGSPTSLITDLKTGSVRGVTVEVGTELARRLGVPYDLIVHQRPAEVLQTLVAGNADITITNATAERAKNLEFAPPLMSLELGLLVRAAQTADMAEFEASDVAIGVSKGSTSEKTLPYRFPRVRIVPFSNLGEASASLLRADIAAFASNKAVLFAMADKTPETRVLDARWGLEHLAIATPKGRDAAKAYLEAFSLQVKGTLIHDAAVRAGLRGQALE